MATKCFCDRCGMPISNLFNMKVLKIKRHFERGGEIWDDYQSYDLCSNCLKNVEEFLQKKQFLKILSNNGKRSHEKF
jgi:hypothetical protein